MCVCFSLQRAYFHMGLMLEQLRCLRWRRQGYSGLCSEALATPGSDRCCSLAPSLHHHTYRTQTITAHIVLYEKYIHSEPSALKQSGRMWCTGLAGSSRGNAWKHRQGREWRRVPSRGRRADVPETDVLWSQDLPGDVGGVRERHNTVSPDVKWVTVDSLTGLQLYYLFFTCIPRTTSCFELPV